MKIVINSFNFIHKKVKQTTSKVQSARQVLVFSFHANLFTIYKAYNEKLLIIYANIRV